MLIWIIAALALYVTQTLLPTGIRYAFGDGRMGAKLVDALSGRDAPPSMPKLGSRAARALTNMQEGLFVFLPMAILAHVQAAGDIAWWGAAFWVAMRTLYVPAYISGIPGVRTFIWTLSWLGLGALVWAVLQPLF